MSLQSTGTQKLGNAPDAYDKAFFNNEFGKINRMFAASSSVSKNGSSLTVSIALKSVSTGGSASVQISLNGSPVVSTITLTPGSDLSVVIG
jgi:hypothetical protein